MLKILVLVGFLWAIPMSLMAQGGDKWGDYRICANKMETNVVRFRLTDASMAAFAEETATCRSESDTACKERAREEAKKIAEDAIYVKTIKHEKHLKNSELNTYTEMISKGKGITQPFCSKRGEDSSGRATYTVRVGVIRIEIPPSEMKQLFPPTVEEKAERLGKEKEEEERLAEMLKKGCKKTDSVSDLLSLGKIFFEKKKKYGKAKQCFERVHSARPEIKESAEADYYLGDIYWKDGKIKKACDRFDRSCKQGYLDSCKKQILLAREQGKKYDNDNPKNRGADSEKAYYWFKKGAGVYKEYYTGQGSKLAWVVYRAVVYHRLRNEDDMSEAEEEKDFKLACNHGVKAACKEVKKASVKFIITNRCAEAKALSVAFFVKTRDGTTSTYPKEFANSLDQTVDCETDNGKIADEICYGARRTNSKLRRFWGAGIGDGSKGCKNEKCCVSCKSGQTVTVPIDLACTRK